MRNLSNHSEREKSKSMNKRFGKKAVQWMVNANLLIIHQDVAKKAALEKKLLMGEEWSKFKKGGINQICDVSKAPKAPFKQSLVFVG